MVYTINNPDNEFFADIKKKIKKNGGYCISAFEKTPDTKCPCKDFRESSIGMCSCGRFIKIEGDEQ